MEPFKIKVVEPLPHNTRQERINILKNTNYDVHNIHARDVIIDLLTDSGCSAMSYYQWSELLRGDESYARASSFTRLEQVVKEITGLNYILPVHQGRGAERVLAAVMVHGETNVYSNGLFVSTRANFSSDQSVAIDLPQKESPRCPFGGNIDLEKLEKKLSASSDKNTIVVLTVTNQMFGGQPVSMENIKHTRTMCDQYGAFLLLDACRFAENAWFIKTKECGFAKTSILSIVQEMFSMCDGCYISAKKDGLCNNGAIMAVRAQEVYNKLALELMKTEGFVTYGGIAGRDMEAMAVGFKEVLQEDYLRYRIESVREFGEILKRNGANVLEPIGGNCIFVDAGGTLDNIDISDNPSWALMCALYVEGGIRCMSMWSYLEEHNLFNRHVVRLAIPRRVFTLSHMLYVGDVFRKVVSRKMHISGFKLEFTELNSHLYPFAKAHPIDKEWFEESENCN